MKIHKQQIAPLLLRIGLAAVFLYAAIRSLTYPDQWIGYLPNFIEKMKDAETLLKVFSIFEILLALWLLSGKYVKFAALIAAVALFGIVISQPSDLAITFRDVGLAFMALGLAALYF